MANEIMSSLDYTVVDGGGAEKPINSSRLFLK
jgi:hypothetical protein